MKTSAPPVKTSSISISSIGVYLNLFERLFLDWNAAAAAAFPEPAADPAPDETDPGLRPPGAHGWMPGAVWTVMIKGKIETMLVG